MLTRITRALGNVVDNALDKFAQWACEKYPVPVEQPNSTDGDHFRAQVIRDHDGSPYITRVLFPRVFGRRVMLHHIHRADFERDLHNHPWDKMTSIILRGSYDEERLGCNSDRCDETSTRSVRWINRLDADTFHRIAKLYGNVWTLFIVGERVQGWGFREWDNLNEQYTVTPNKLYLGRKRVEAEQSSEDMYYGTPTQLEDASGATLDMWGSILRLPRQSAFDSDWIESDDAYRARLLAKANP